MNNKHYFHGKDIQKLYDINYDSKQYWKQICRL